MQNNLGPREKLLLWDAIEGVLPDETRISARDCFLIDFGQAVANRNLHPELVQRMKELYSEEGILRLTDLAAQGLAQRLLRDIVPRRSA